jgi:hypothetical protein
MRAVLDARFFCVGEADGDAAQSLEERPVNQGRANQALLLLLGCIAGGYFLLALHPIWDIDVFWHIRTGEWVVENLSLPSTDIFSAVDPAREWVPFQWLYEVICYGADEAGGLFLVRVLHGLVAAAGIVAAGLALWKERAALVPVTVILSAFLFADRLRARPDVFNLLLFWCLLPLVREWKWSRRRIVGVLVIAVLWANIHAGGALLVPILLLARLAGRVSGRWVEGRLGHAAQGGGEKAEGSSGEGTSGREHATRNGAGEILRGARSDLLVFGLSAGLMCLMPGFVQGVYQAFFMLGPSARFIPEWMGSIEFLLEHASSLHEYLAGGLAVAGLPLLAVAIGWRVLGRRDGSGIPDLVLCVPLAALSLLHVRFIWLAAPVLALFLLRAMATSATSASGWRLALLGVVHGVIGLVTVGLLALDVHYHVMRNGGGPEKVVAGFGVDLEPGYFPERAAGFLADAGIEGRVLNHAPWGGYLLYRLWPKCRVATDGRGNFGDLEATLLSAMDSVSRRGGAIAAATEKVPFDLVVHPAPFPTWDATPERLLWVYHDDHARVYLRVGEDNLENIRRVARASGVDVRALPAPSEATGWDEVQRAFVRRWAVERLFQPPYAGRVEELSRRADGGEREAARELALLYFDLGLFAECRQVLPGAGVQSVDDEALELLAWWADGYSEETVAACTSLGKRLEAGDSLAPRARNVVFAVCRRAMQNPGTP